MTNYICSTCGTQFAATGAPPAHCPICEDERQYIGLERPAVDHAGSAAAQTITT